MTSKLTGTHTWGWYCELPRATHNPHALNNTTMTITRMTTTQSVSESYQGEMLFLNSGFWPDFIN
jgi:hypothetical protein